MDSPAVPPVSVVPSPLVVPDAERTRVWQPPQRGLLVLIAFAAIGVQSVPQ